MKKIILYSISLLWFSISCNSKKEEKTLPENKNAEVKSDFEKQAKPMVDTLKLNKSISGFIPKGYVLYKDEIMKDIKGDLNKDGLEDCVLIIKGTDKSEFVDHEYRGKLDRNRRGIVILFNKGDHYELALENKDCFSSENEEGGVYYAPELMVSAEKGNLYVHYAHGRYGYWNYTFRYQNHDFEMIGYDSSENRGPVVQYMTSINFMTKKKLTKENLNKDDPGDDYTENFKDTWEKLEDKPLLKLSEIRDFDELSF
ncbi:hypothetical protein [Chryseobacterium sp.]|uniref:hypothetical protein n=1 Tax=Chryseobacterium sp. TaxID=1871047 RepID=UPI0028A236FA|nr:hypothetical protein [Chryseobacterium sp.]